MERECGRVRAVGGGKSNFYRELYEMRAEEKACYASIAVNEPVGRQRRG